MKLSAVGEVVVLIFILPASQRRSAQRDSVTRHNTRPMERDITECRLPGTGDTFMTDWMVGDSHTNIWV